MLKQAVDAGIQDQEETTVTADETARILVDLLVKDQFASGSHIGYND